MAELMAFVLNNEFDPSSCQCEVLLSRKELAVTILSPQLMWLMANMTVIESTPTVITKSASLIYADATFNIGLFYVTPFAFQVVALQKVGAIKSPPLIHALIVLHKNETINTYTIAYQSLMRHFVGEPKFSIGDGCKKQRKGCEVGAPQWTNLDCWVHFKKALQDLSSVSQEQKKKILENLLDSQSRKEFEEIWDDLPETPVIQNKKKRLENLSYFRLQELGFPLDPNTNKVMKPDSNPIEGGHNKLKIRLGCKLVGRKLSEVEVVRKVFKCFLSDIAMLKEALSGQNGEWQPAPHWVPFLSSHANRISQLFQGQVVNVAVASQVAECMLFLSFSHDSSLDFISTLPGRT